MTFSVPNPKPKRIGGAPFTAAPGARRGPLKLPLSARTTVSKYIVADDPSLAEKPASARCRSSTPGVGRRDGAATPLTKRAEQYYSNLLGLSASSDTRQDWALVQELDAADHINREEKLQRSARERQKKNRAELQAQSQARNHIAAQCREVWTQWGAELAQDTAKFQKEQEATKAARTAAQQEHCKERERHLEEARRRKIQQKQDEVKVEREMMMKAEQAKQRQDEADEKKKLAQRESMQMMHVEAQEAQKRRKEAKAKERLQDVKDQKKFTELLDQQERERGKYFHVIRDKQQQRLAKYEDGIGNEIAKLQTEDDERAKRQAAERHDKERQKHEEEEHWRQRLRDSGKVAVDQQLALQAEERQRQRNEERRFLEQQHMADEIAESKENDKKSRKKQEQYANAQFLREQMQEKEAQGPRSKVGRSQMNDAERCLNHDRLQRACDANRADGLPMLLRRKRAEYLQLQRESPTSMPC